MTPAPLPPPSAPTGGDLEADVLAAAVSSTPGVAGLHGGRYGEVATYRPGRRVVGIRSTTAGIEVHVVAWPDALPAVADRIRAAVAPHAGGRAVDVVIGDLADPTPPAPTAAPQTPPPTAPAEPPTHEGPVITDTQEQTP